MARLLSPCRVPGGYTDDRPPLRSDGQTGDYWAVVARHRKALWGPKRADGSWGPEIAFKGTKRPRGQNGSP